MSTASATSTRFSDGCHDRRRSLRRQGAAWQPSPVTRLAPLAIIALAATRAAACPIDLVGEPAITAAVAGELASFGDDSGPCLALRVECAAADGGLTVDLRDELDGRARRTFESPAGAAAFLVSWSRRPLVGAPPQVASPIAVAATRAPARLEASSAGWSPTFALAGTGTPDALGGSLTASAAYRAGAWAAQLGGRLASSYTRYVYDQLGGGLLMFLGIQAEASLRRTLAVQDAGSVAVELATGGTAIVRITQSGEPALDSLGPHSAARFILAWRLQRALAIELAFAVDAMWQTQGRERSPIGHDDIIAFPHIDLGLRWEP